MKDILIGYRYGYNGLTFCDDESTLEILKCLADEMDRRLAAGEPVYKVEFEYGSPLRGPWDGE